MSVDLPERMTDGVRSDAEAAPRWRVPFFALSLVCGLAIAATVILFADPSFQLGGEVVLAAIFYGASRAMQTNTHLRKSSDVFFAFFIFTVAAIMRTVGVGVVTIYAPNDQVLVPFVDAIAVVATVLILTRASGRPMASIYLRRGNLRFGLTVGSIGFFGLFFGILVGFQLLYGNPNGIPFVRLLSLSPIVLALAFLNAPKEELWFRGIFLGKSEPLLGRRLANLLQAPLFALAHLNAEYSQFGPGFQIAFLLLVFLLGLVWGYLIQRTDSIIGSSLIHAGADVAIFLPILLSLL